MAKPEKQNTESTTSGDENPPGGSPPATTTETATAAPDAKPVKRKTPEEWARALRHFKAKRPNIPQDQDHHSIAHATADQLHGWSNYAYHHQATPFELTKEDYEAALKAGLEFPCCAPHAAALPPGEERRFVNFVPSKSCKAR